MAAEAMRFRLRLGSGVALRSSRLSACATFFTADRRPKCMAAIPPISAFA